MIYLGGRLIVKILKRTATFEGVDISGGRNYSNGKDLGCWIIHKLKLYSADKDSYTENNMQ